LPGAPFSASFNTAVAYFRWSRYFLPTWKEEPKEAEIPSHRIMLRAGLARKVASGIYEFLPLGCRALRKVERIVREELEAVGAQEVKLPTLHPEELWRRTGRWEDFGPELFKLTDRKGQRFALAPTHEEIITELAAREIHSWRDLPLVLYQITEKFRDEPRPRFGLLRTREFLMKDAYSFHSSWDSLEATYQELGRAYRRIFARCGLNFRLVEAPTGVMGGNVSHEFLALAAVGEAEIALCQSCGYSACREIAALKPLLPPPGEEAPAELVATPGVRTVEELVSFLGISPAQVVKTFLYVGRKGPLAVLVRGDRELAEAKLLQAAGDPTLQRVDDPREAEALSGAPFGFLGPIGLPFPVWADQSIQDIPAAVVGGNREGFHYLGAKPGRDFQVEKYLDLHWAGPGDPCARCGAPLEINRGIELGQIFQLGTKYSQALGATFLDPDGEEKPLVMGCYGIGVSRLLGAVIEQWHDEKGIIWPPEVAPFQVLVSVLRPDVEEQMALGEEMAQALDKAGLEVLLDDRLLSPGEKFHDAKLIGIPVLAIVGPRALARGQLELERRVDGHRLLSPLEPEAVVKKVQHLLRGG